MVWNLLIIQLLWQMVCCYQVVFCEEGFAIGGNPAKVIGTWNHLRTKVEIYGNNVVDVKELREQHPDKLIRK